MAGAVGSVVVGAGSDSAGGATAAAGGSGGTGGCAAPGAAHPLSSARITAPGTIAFALMPHRSCRAGPAANDTHGRTAAADGRSLYESALDRVDFNGLDDRTGRNDRAAIPQLARLIADRASCRVTMRK